MSIAFSNTTTKKGLIQEIESECGFNDGDISGDTTRLAKTTVLINTALDDYWAIALPASGTWQLDDSNHTDYPVITTNLVSGQRDYSFTTDGSSNLILDIYKILILPSATATVYDEVYPVDETEHVEMIDGNDNDGAPIKYGKMGNGIFLEPIPNYNATNGLKILINREASYFATSDTTKKPGIPGIHHKYLVLKASLDYARRNSLNSYNRIQEEVTKMEAQIREHFGNRERDTIKKLTPNITPFQ